MFISNLRARIGFGIRTNLGYEPNAGRANVGNVLPAMFTYFVQS